MNRLMRASCVLCVVLLGAACGSNSEPSGSGGGGAADASIAVDAGGDLEVDAAVPVELDGFTETVAGAICDALFRCCDDDLEVYFSGYAFNDLLADYHDRLPPMAQLSAAECPALVAEMIDIVPFGDWIREVRAGRATLDVAGYTACLQQLESATCGESMRDALFDEECFGFAAPLGPRQRAMFSRDAATGDTCGPIRDGVGAGFYGTCNPSTHHCCYISDTQPELGCTYPFTADGVLRSGTCQPVAATGNSCQFSPPLALCATGSECDFDLGTCYQPTDNPLSLGATCADEGFTLLGRCVDGWCDLFGSLQCEPTKDTGADCSAAYECTGGACQDSLCVDTTLCVANGS